MDQLLENLYKVHSPSNKEDAMVDFLKKELEDVTKYGILEITVDDSKNIYIRKGSGDLSHHFFPCAVAHIDQVQKSPLTHVFQVDDTVFGWSCKENCQEGLGADDKNGIWCVLKLLQSQKTMKAAFFVGEEIGCVGSGKANLDFFKDVKFIIQADRRGSSDIIFNANSTNIASDSFKDCIKKLYENRGYKPTTGLSTDVWKLAGRGVGVSCCNISCGYYNPHTSSEYTVLSELDNCLDLMKAIFEKVSFRCPNTATSTIKQYTSTAVSSYPSSTYHYTGGYYGHTYDYYDDDDVCYGTPKTYSQSSSTTSSSANYGNTYGYTQEINDMWFNEFEKLTEALVMEDDYDVLDLKEYYKVNSAHYPHLMPRDFVAAQFNVIAMYGYAPETSSEETVEVPATKTSVEESTTPATDKK